MDPRWREPRLTQTNKCGGKIRSDPSLFLTSRLRVRTNRAGSWSPTFRTLRVSRTSEGRFRKYHVHTTRITPGTFHLFVGFRLSDPRRGLPIICVSGCTRPSQEDCDVQDGGIYAPCDYPDPGPASRSVPFVQNFFLHFRH
jgi:hypothetical protein